MLDGCDNTIVHNVIVHGNAHQGEIIIRSNTDEMPDYASIGDAVTLPFKW